MSKVVNDYEITLYDIIRSSFNVSTKKHNFFAQALNEVTWDETFEADGEYYFIYKDFTFSTPYSDPFKVTAQHEACVQFSDGSFIYFH